MRREAPIKRRNPSGEIVWMVRYTGRGGRRHIAKPSWNRGKGTFKRKGDAQKAIDEAYGLSDRPDTRGDYSATWTERHPRSERTNATNDHRISRVADVEIEGRGWGRCYLCAAKTSTARPSRSGAPPTRARSSRERRPTTASPTPAASSRCQRPSPGCSKLRSTSTAPTASSSSRPPGGRLWRERIFYRDLWKPAQEASGLDIRRHSYITQLRAAGMNDADLAEIAGHRVETMLARYTHAVGRSFSPVRDADG